MLVSAGVATGVLGAVLSVRNRRRVVAPTATSFAAAEPPRAIDPAATNQSAGGKGERVAADRAPFAGTAPRG